jgi:hypothetical protein
MATRMILATALCGALAAAAPAHAQLPTPTARSVGLGNSFSAVATGHRAVAWNPAGLGVPDRGGWSLALLPFQAAAGLDPLGLDELRRFEEEDLDLPTRRAWLERIRAAGSLHGTAGGDITWIGLHVGRLGFQLSSGVYGVANLAPDVAELILFEEDAFPGDGRQLDFFGSALHGSVATTGALSYGFRIPVAGVDVAAAGVTVKYTVGHGMLAGRDGGSIVGSDRGTLNFPVIYTDVDRPESGRGVGVDVGFTARRGPWTAAAAIRNVINTFTWDEATIRVWPGQAAVDRNGESADFTAVPLRDANPRLREVATELLAITQYRPVLALAGAYAPDRRVLLTGELRRRFGEGLGADPAAHAGLGAELRPVMFLPLRVGVAAVQDGYQVAGGAGLEAGGVQLNAGLLQRHAAERTSTVAMLSLSFGMR